MEPSTGIAAARTRARWWKEVLLIAAFYLAYTLVRDTQGSASVSAAHAFGNATRVIGLEKVLDLFHEQAIQHAVIGWRGLMTFLDDFYGSAHFILTIAVLAWLYFRHHHRYRRWRNTLAITTGLALVGFTVFPLMPPRLLPAPYHFVDTLRTIGGLWNFDSGTMAKVSDQYAAMPSLHFAWSAWCAAAVSPLFKKRWAQLAVFCYPALTLFAIIATANHYFLDVIFGALTLVLAYAISVKIDQFHQSSGKSPSSLEANPGP
ncbi:MAG: phosphatase PAP2 family protein [Acidimicrobiales bacterium]